MVTCAVHSTSTIKKKKVFEWSLNVFLDVYFLEPLMKRLNKLRAGTAEQGKEIGTKATKAKSAFNAKKQKLDRKLVKEQKKRK